MGFVDIYGCIIKL